jgi:hypothetical protein
MSMNDALLQLSAMGFDESQSQLAISHTNGNLEKALEFLLNGGVDNNTNTNNNTNTINDALIQCGVSQYSLQNGRSACTCIALLGAVLFLQSEANQVTPAMLERMIHQGVQIYEKIASVMEGEVEHLSVDEVLQEQVPEFERLWLQGGARQGVLGTSPDLGLKSILQACQYECPNRWMSVVVTKTPETVVVFLSPEHYVLMDSHPRPPFTENAHAYTFDSLDELVTKLQGIFPHADLGPDVPEVMAMMYNSFDMYPLVLRAERSAPIPKRGVTRFVQNDP